jgi:16S rRNA (adenine1518-N6/adenine1519-N6)-dimethyltransferase
MTIVRAKKHLGQHFLNDENIAKKIVSSLSQDNNNVLEIGPGMGILTKHLLQRDHIHLKAIEVDNESVEYLHDKFPEMKSNIIHADFLKANLCDIFPDSLSVIGNFPYNISSQILFKVLDYRHLVTETVGMFQKEVAVRIAAPPGNKDYGILSVLLQAFYHIEFLFTVSENVFTPPPNVKSAVIRLRRNQVEYLDCDEEQFFRVVKTGFNQRRKTLRNALSSIGFEKEILLQEIFSKRAEQLSVQDFIHITQMTK